MCMYVYVFGLVRSLLRGCFMTAAPASPPVARLRSSVAVAHHARVVANNIRRLMASHGMTYDDVVVACELDERTVRGIARGEKNPHARTLQRLAEGFGVEVDELFVDAASIAAAGFDAETNPLVSKAIAANPALFEGWSAADFAELSSRFGHGGALSEQGAIEAAEQMNRKREVLAAARVVLESSDGPLLEEFVKMLYERVQVRS